MKDLTVAMTANCCGAPCLSNICNPYRTIKIWCDTVCMFYCCAWLNDLNKHETWKLSKLCMFLYKQLTLYRRFNHKGDMLGIFSEWGMVSWRRLGRRVWIDRLQDHCELIHASIIINGFHLFFSVSLSLNSKYVLESVDSGSTACVWVSVLKQLFIL